MNTSTDPSATPTEAPVKTRGRVLPSPVTPAEIALVAVLVVLWIALALATPAFLSAGSIIPLLVEVAPVALIGIGMTFVIITGGIDVSVGGAIMVCSVITAKLMRDQALPVWWCLVVAIGTGAVLGLVNGALIAYGRVHAIIITFGTANLFLFVGLQIFASQPIAGMPNTLAWFGRGVDGRTFATPHSFAITVVLAALASWYLRNTPGGRHFFGVGGDPLAARLAGIRVQRRILIAYAITGLLVGLASIFTLAKGTSNLDQSVGSGQELAVIAAVVIGGTSIMGGRGSVLGTVLGALLVQTVKSGVTQLGWPSQLSDLFVGIFIVVAVGTDLVRRRARRDP
ncbi:ABC transporter permease [Mycolicibacterium hodleri]|uniref:Autoinducer 2 import system permease protein LsrC n=1 Tax=Mycolicibacterium hodleri TaxID=49897 RepID=A0A502E4U8_9MYCO|nr:ABC transporter permease [Mycolicibacterium hodleri]TPG32758.1 ABC transporter permease [Mycolicibacterium hodleri]